jgi:hypothetical protein
MSRFGIVPTYWARAANLSCTDKAVLVALSTYASSDGFCWPAVPTLAACLGVSDRTVQRSLQTLADVGAVHVQRRADDSGRSSSNGYWLLGYDSVIPSVLEAGAGDTSVTDEGDSDDTVPVTPVSPKQYQLKQDQIKASTTTATSGGLPPFAGDVAEAFEALRATAPNPRAMEAVLRAQLEGMQGAQYTAEEVGNALLDTWANGAGWNAALFRGYLRKHRTAQLTGASPARRGGPDWDAIRREMDAIDAAKARGVA